MRLVFNYLWRELNWQRFSPFFLSFPFFSGMCMYVCVCTGYGQQVHAYYSAHVGVRRKPRSSNSYVIERSLLRLLLHHGGSWKSGPRFARQVLFICWFISLAQTVFWERISHRLGNCQFDWGSGSLFTLPVLKLQSLLCLAFYKSSFFLFLVMCRCLGVWEECVGAHKGQKHQIPMELVL